MRTLPSALFPVLFLFVATGLAAGVVVTQRQDLHTPTARAEEYLSSLQAMSEPGMAVSWESTSEAIASNEAAAACPRQKSLTSPVSVKVVAIGLGTTEAEARADAQRRIDGKIYLSVCSLKDFPECKPLCGKYDGNCGFCSPDCPNPHTQPTTMAVQGTPYINPCKYYEEEPGLAPAHWECEVQGMAVCGHTLKCSR